MAVVGTLTVDLVANTASFQSDLGKAGDGLNDLGKSAQTAGKNIDFSMAEAKGSIMLLGEELGVRIPRHLQTLLAEIPGVGLAFSAMLPLVGVTAAIALLYELIRKSEEAKEKLAESTSKLGVAEAGGLSALDDKMLEVGRRADELAGSHLAALREELLLIDRSTLHQLAGEFQKLSGAAEEVFGNLKAHWYEMHVASEGARHALTEFRGQYELLIAQGKSKEASDLLKGTLDSAKASLHTMQTAGFVARGMGEVSKEGVESQKAWIDVLQTQVQIEQKLHDIGSGEKQNAKTEEGQEEAKRQYGLYEEQQKGLAKRFDAEKRYYEERKKAAKKAADEEIKIHEEEGEATRAVFASVEKTSEALANEGMKNALAMAKIKGSAEEQEAKHALAMRKSSAAEATTAELEASEKRLTIEVAALDRESAVLEQAAIKDTLKLKEIEDKKTQLIAAATAEQTKIREAAEQRQYNVTSAAEERIAGAFAKTATESLFHGKNMAQAFAKTGEQMLESATENVLKMVAIQNFQKLSDAKVAAANAYAAVSAIPVVGPFLAPAAAGAAFAGVLAFERGGEIPGSGAVPIIGHGGETVVTKALTDQVKNNTGGGQGPSIHYAPVIHAIDSDGVEKMLHDHSTAFTRHVTTTLRKMNKRG